MSIRPLVLWLPGFCACLGLPGSSVVRSCCCVVLPANWHSLIWAATSPIFCNTPQLYWVKAPAAPNPALFPNLMLVSSYPVLHRLSSSLPKNNLYISPSLSNRQAFISRALYFHRSQQLWSRPIMTCSLKWDLTLSVPLWP